jgi:hypothetical protein
LPESWNANRTITFRYKFPHGGSREILIRISRLGNNAVVDAIEIGDNQQRGSFDVFVHDYISSSALPSTPVTDTSASDKEAAIKSINEIFVSDEKLRELAILSVRLAQKFVRGSKTVSEESTSPRSESGRFVFRSDEPSSSSDPQRAPPPDSNKPAPTLPGGYNPYAPGVPSSRPRVPAAGEQPPGFEDEYDIYRPPGRGSGQQPRNPLSIGHDDLYPPGMGPNDPFRPTLGPGGLRQPGAGGGMHPTFDDPMFGGGQQGFEDPQAPAGARYDPTGPNDPRAGLNFPGAGHRGGFGGFGGRGGGPGGFGGFPGGDFI